MFYINIFRTKYLWVITVTTRDWCLQCHIFMVSCLKLFNKWRITQKKNMFSFGIKQGCIGSSSRKPQLGKVCVLLKENCFEFVSQSSWLPQFCTSKCGISVPPPAHSASSLGLSLRSMYLVYIRSSHVLWLAWEQQLWVSPHPTISGILGIFPWMKVHQQHRPQQSSDLFFN